MSDEPMAIKHSPACSFHHSLADPVLFSKPQVVCRFEEEVSSLSGFWTLQFGAAVQATAALTGQSCPVCKMGIPVPRGSELQ